jgi:type I site-specific restriction endonuclease
VAHGREPGRDRTPGGRGGIASTVAEDRHGTIRYRAYGPEWGAAGRPDPEQPLRYYQEAAVTRAVEAIASGRPRALLTLCTGAGKTPIAFQIAWRLHAARWTAIPGRLRARVIFLADRDVLVKDPQNRHFAPFGEGRHRILESIGLALLAHGRGVVKTRTAYVPPVGRA